MKKIKSIACIVFAVIIFTTTACGNKTGETSANEPTTEDNQVLASAIVPVNKITHYKGDTIADNVYSSVSYDELIIDEDAGKTYAALEDTFSKKAATDLEECDKAYSELGVDFTPYGDSYTSLYSNTDSYVIRSDGKVVSILDYKHSYLGGVHDSHSYKTHNYDTTTGEEISLSDVVTDETALLKILDEMFLEKYTSNYFYTPSEYQNENPDYQIQFVIGYDGISFYYDEYLLNAYAAGPFLTFISFDELEGIVDTKYLPEINTWITPFGSLINPMRADYDGDGTLNELSDDPYFTDYGDYTYSYNGNEVTFNGYYSYDSYIVNVEGTYYLYVFAHGDNDYVDFKVIDLQTFKQKIDRSDKAEHSLYSDKKDSNGYTGTLKYVLTDPDKLVLETRFNIFSTYYGYRTYEVQPEGRLYANDEYYLIDSDKVLKTTAEITFQKVDEEGNILSEETLPSGTLLAFVRTNEESIVDFVVVDESEISTEDYGVAYRTVNDLSVKEGKDLYRLEFSGSIGERTFQGMTEEEAFEICYYAG